jgi:hypothetical protein
MSGLDHDPGFLQPGSGKIKFKREHIIDIWSADNDQAISGPARDPDQRGENSQVTRTVYRHQISNAPAARMAATMDGIDLAASGGHHDRHRRLPG